MEKLKHHLHFSKLHYMSKLEADEMAESYDGWLQHDTDEEDVPPGLDAPSVNNGAPLDRITNRRSRSAPQTPSPPPEGRRRRHNPRLALEDNAVPVWSSRTPNDRHQETLYRRIYIAIESSIRAARHAERLSMSAADAFDREAKTLERALDALTESL